MTKRVKLHDTAKIPKSMPACPIALNDVGMAEWNRLGPILLKDGRLSDERSATAFALYCDAWTRYLKAAEDVRTHGSTLTSDTKYGKVIKPNPAAADVARSLAAIIRLGSEFGIAPRGKQRNEQEVEVADDLDSFNREFG